jgi:hypothetical protein
VHGAEAVVELRRNPDGASRIGKLPADEHRQREADQQEEQAGEAVQDPDDLVVCGKQMPEEQAGPIL